MARKATRDTYGIEIVGGVEVRRLVKAGDVIPDTYSVEGGSVEGGPAEAPAAGADATAPPNPGVGTADTPVEDLKGDDLESAIEEHGGYEALGLASDAKADEKRSAVAEARGE